MSNKSDLYRSDICSSGVDQREYEMFQSLLDRVYLKSALDLLLAGLRNSVKSEMAYKHVERAKVLKIAGEGKYQQEYAAGLNHRAIDQLKAASQQVRMAVEKLDVDTDTTREIDEAIGNSAFQTSVQVEILPEVRKILLESDATPTETGYLYKGLGDAEAYSTPIRNTLKDLANEIDNLTDTRGKPGRGKEADTKGVPVWKVIATKVIVLIIRALIAICKTWNAIVCAIIEWIWKLIEKRVIEEVYGWCRDQPAVEG